jgi:hypothetical protein
LSGIVVALFVCGWLLYRRKRYLKVTHEGVEIQGRFTPEEVQEYVAMSCVMVASKMGVVIEHNKGIAGAINALTDAQKIVRGDAG